MPARNRLCRFGNRCADDASASPLLVGQHDPPIPFGGPRRPWIHTGIGEPLRNSGIVDAKLRRVGRHVDHGERRGQAKAGLSVEFLRPIAVINHGLAVDVDALRRAEPAGRVIRQKALAQPETADAASRVA